MSFDETSVNVKFNIQELINLFNKHNPKHSKHISAIQGMIGEELVINLFHKYLTDKTNFPAEILEDKPTERNRGNSNKRLDYWICQKTKLYQIEVKNWSIYSFGINNDEYLKGRTNFDRIWNLQTCRFKENQKLDKVLHEMNIPKAYEEKKVIPVVCFWFPLSYNNRKSPVINLNVNKSRFRKIIFFSASNYLNMLANQGVEHVDLKMENLSTRNRLVKKLNSKK